MGKRKGTPEKPPTNGKKPAANEGEERLPAYFLSLSLENVRCFGPKQTLDLSDGRGKPARWTIILGVNGTGKTTTLQALVGFDAAPSVDNPQKQASYPRFFTTVDHVYSFRRGREPEFSRIAISIAGAESISVAPILSSEPHLEIRGGVASYSSGLGAGSPGGGVVAPWCCAYGAGRRLGTATLSGIEPDDPTATLFSDRAELQNPEEWLLRLDYAAKSHVQTHEPRDRLAQAKELLLSVMPDDAISDIQLTSSSGPSPQPRAEFKTPDGWVPLRQLGYGYQTLITWVADLANRMAERYPDSPNPLAEPAVVLVDEIDLHLHPVWQRKLIGFLTERFPNTQFIATAHSPLMVQAAADANLAVLRREGDHVVIDNDVDNIRNWRVDQILTSDLFGLETARPPHIEAQLLERKKLLSKSKLTAAEKRRVEELEKEIGHLPYGETPQERKEREEIRKTLDLLMKERKPAQ